MRSTKTDAYLIEANVEDAVIDYAEGYGFFRRKIKWIGRRAAPDNIFAKNGIIFFIEFKKPGKDLRLDQKREVKRMRDAGIKVYVIDDIKKGCDLIDYIQANEKAP